MMLASSSSARLIATALVAEFSSSPPRQDSARIEAGRDRLLVVAPMSKGYQLPSAQESRPENSS